MTDVRFLSVCSGIEAVSVATAPLFWRAAGFAEIDRAGKPAADGPRYKQLGNSMAVPVIRWICFRIDAELSQPTRGQP